MNARQFASLLFEQAAKTDDTGLLAPHLWSEFRRSNLAMAAFPQKWGGAGLNEPARHHELCTILRVLGAADLSMARLFEGHVNAIGLVSRFGSAHQLQDLAQRISGGGLAAVWGADDAKGLLVQRGSIATLCGRKILASGAGFVSDPLVTARDGGETKMCLLQLSMKELVDLSGWNALGMRSTATGAIDLSGTVLTAENFVGQAGDFTRQPYFSGGAWRFCAAHVGASEKLVDLFRDHLVERGRGHDAYQLQRMAQAVTCAKTARFWVEDAARRLSFDDQNSEAVVAHANLTRMVTERCALDVMETVQRGVGLTAFVRPHPIERISRDLATYLRQPVPDLAMSDGAKTFLTSGSSVGEL